jgi:cell fate regulator YaaT (PSP1 superfamily)
MKIDDITLRGCAAQSVLENGGKCNPHSCNKLNVFNDLRNYPLTANTPDIVEIRFKNTRKAFYKNIANINLTEGDMVAVEASPGHDIGTVSLTGELVKEQMKRKGVPSDGKLRVIYRKVKPSDVEKWEVATRKENEIMLKARRITKKLNLEMKIGDVEFQGDGTKAIFYYIADNRVDFRELIKILAEEFNIRVEMRQIGARQEAGRIGGIGSCGRELCCSSWMSDFISVSTDSARDQQLSMNPQKLAGQCSKLKCCINYEKDSYKEALQVFPPGMNLETEAGTAYFMKIDVFRQLVWYSFSKTQPENVTCIKIDRVYDIIEMNKQGKKPEKLTDSVVVTREKTEYEDLAGQESINRFDKNKKKKKKKKHRKDTNNPSV